MTIEATLERIEQKLDLLLKPSDKQPAEAPAPTAAAPKPRGRAKPAAEAPAATPDPFEAAPPTSAPVASLDDVRTALTALKDATTQANAVGVLKSAGGVDNLSALPAAKYDAVVAAAKQALGPTPTPAAEVDPFETEAAPEVVTEKPVSLEDVKAAVVAAQGRTGVQTVQKIVMDHGGKAAGPNGTGPSLKALPVTEYAKVIAAVNALPTTK